MTDEQFKRLREFAEAKQARMSAYDAQRVVSTAKHLLEAYLCAVDRMPRSVQTALSKAAVEFLGYAEQHARLLRFEGDK